MYVGIDIGGTKTLVASFSEAGEKTAEEHFPTSPDYRQFLADLEPVAQKFIHHDAVHHAAVAVPGLLDREKGLALALGNLPWKNITIAKDISHILMGTPVTIENDAKLAGLAEAIYLRDSYSPVLYLTISTGIGGALIENDRIVKVLRDSEVGKMPLHYEEKVVHWETFASGQSIVARYKKRASEIDDPKIWQEIAARISYGVGILCSVMQPQAIVFGGGAGQYADKFKDFVGVYLREHLHADVRQPKAILAPHYAAESVIYGCYELAKQNHANFA